MDTNHHHRHHEEEETYSSSSSSSPPHEAMFFVLAYLPLYELLVMTQVCKSLRYAVETDIIPWLNIIVDRPLSTRLNDDHLLNIAVPRATGRLQRLSLINCVKITDSALLRVASQNPHITKLHVPGCTNITPKGIIEAARLLTTENHNLESVRVSGIYNIRKEDYHILTDLIKPPKQGNIFFYHRRFSSHNADRAIDVGICPRCNEVTMVFDCPRARCECKGCISCIPRCSDCGVCLKKDEEPEEACCGDELCLDCWLRLPKCSFCNKPYCSMHLDRRRGLQGSSAGFVCSECYFEFTSCKDSNE